MHRLLARSALVVSALVAATGFVACGGSPRQTSERSDTGTGGQAPRGAGSHADLVTLFQEWRQFEEPPLLDGAPDYTPAAIDKRRQGLEDFRRRLAAIDPSAWPVPEQVDYHLVRAEMNGLDFNIRVLQPWVRDPA
jgi:hypothetical protein